MPNRPITAIRKSKPLSSCSKPNVMRSCAGHARRGRPSPAQSRGTSPRSSSTDEPRPMPTKLANVRKNTEKNSAGPNCSAKRAISGARKVMRMTATQRADERRREGGRQRFVGAALLRHRMAVEGGRDRPWLARNIEEDRCDRAAEQRSPVDAGEHDDGRRRRHRERQRQQDRDAVGAAQSRQHADDDPKQDADEHQCQVVRGQRDAEPLHQRGNLFHDRPSAPAVHPVAGPRPRRGNHRHVHLRPTCPSLRAYFFVLRSFLLIRSLPLIAIMLTLTGIPYTGSGCGDKRRRGRWGGGVARSVQNKRSAPRPTDVIA